MKRSCVFLPVLVIAMSMVTVKAAEPPSVALVEFQAQGVAPHEAGIITDRLRSQLVKTGAFKVMERSQMETILKEQGFQQSGICNDASCMAEIGKILSVRRMIAGSVGKIGSLFTLDLRLFDVQTGEILFTHSEDVRGAMEDVLLTAVPKIVEKLAKEAGNEQARGYVTVTSAPSGAKVLIDSVENGTTPLKGLEAASGDRMIGVALEGYAAQQRMVRVVKNDTQAVAFTLSPTSEKLTEDKKVKQSKRRTVGKVLRWSGAVVGLAGAGVAAICWLNADAKHKQYDESADPDEASGLWDETNQSAQTGNIGAIIGGLGVIFLGVSFAF